MKWVSEVKQVTNKWYTLKRGYDDALEEMKRGVAQEDLSFPYFDLMDELLGNSPAYTLKSVVEVNQPSAPKPKVE